MATIANFGTLLLGRNIVNGKTIFFLELFKQLPDRFAEALCPYPMLTPC